MALEGQVRSVAGANSSAVDLVTSEIRRAVLTGALPAGEQFSIRDLAAQLGVSHIPIREALRRLESQGLIVLRQARSASVAPLSTSDLEAIYRLRYLIELPLAGASAGATQPERRSPDSTNCSRRAATSIRRSPGRATTTSTKHSCIPPRTPGTIACCTRCGWPPSATRTSSSTRRRSPTTSASAGTRSTGCCGTRRCQTTPRR